MANAARLEGLFKQAVLLSQINVAKLLLDKGTGGPNLMVSMDSVLAYCAMNPQPILAVAAN